VHLLEKALEIIIVLNLDVVSQSCKVTEMGLFFFFKKDLAGSGMPTSKMR
jgi:hypothetical protein